MAPSTSTAPGSTHHQVWLQRSNPEIRLHYIECLPTAFSKPLGTILLIHGFPETSYQFRKVIPPLASAGYRVLAPDYRGAGYSSKPPSGYTKKDIATDLHTLLTEHLGIKEKVHLVGHDIGGMITHAYCALFPDSVESVVWGECPLPGSTVYENTKHSLTLWHFDFHSVPDISVQLVQGKERMYIKHFYDRLAQNPEVFTNADLDFYETQYAMPGALRAAFSTYATFEEDAEHNRQWREEKGKVKVRSMVLSGAGSFIAEEAENMGAEFYEDTRHVAVEGSGHWIAEEQPARFSEEVLGFIEGKKRDAKDLPHHGGPERVSIEDVVATN